MLKPKVNIVTARKKKHTKKKKTKRKIKGRGYFPQNQYNTYNYSRKRKQRGGFLNRYDFAYAGRDTVKQASKELQRIGPGLLKKAIEELYQTPFRMLETAIKRNVSNELKKLKLL